jgi:hypothetical protein
MRNSLQPLPLPVNLKDLSVAFTAYTNAPNASEKSKEKNRVASKFKMAMKDAHSSATLQKIQNLMESLDPRSIEDPKKNVLPLGIRTHLKTKLANIRAIEAKQARKEAAAAQFQISTV